MNSDQRVPIFDGHNDLLLRLALAGEDSTWSFFEENTLGHLDYPRAKRGGFAGGFFAVFVPSQSVDDSLLGRAEETRAGGYFYPMASPVARAEAVLFAARAIEALFKLERDSKGGFKVVRSASELAQAIAQETMAAVLHFEGAEPIDEGLEALDSYYAQGLRSLGIVWSRPNAFGHGVPFRFPHSPDTGAGLSDAGKRLVRRCNALGIMLDLSHLNEQGFWDVEKLSDRPLVATHSACHAICASARNLTDRQIDAVGASGGIIGINFAVRDLREDGRYDDDVPLSQLVRHVDYVVRRIGIDHVALGSDFDGTKISRHIQDASGLPQLVAALRQHGYDDSALAKLGHQNWLRVLASTW
ncbi:MAG: membrane dipeptidase [Bradymonadaceae bacterium]|nr:membrane dipeptidase [Lujinxingiaceae bacterium]